MKILVVAAHPDDEVLGCGGTVARFVAEGATVRILVLGEGVTSRDESRNRQKRSKELSGLQGQLRAACAVIGVKGVSTHDFPDNRFDTVPFLDIVKTVEKVKEKVRPDIVFTHYMDDLNIDHRITYDAVMTAVRPLPNETVKEVYSFEILSSTGWRYRAPFAANVFFDISKTLGAKIRAMEQYKGELRDYPHPRSKEGIETSARYWGMMSGARFAEAFQVVRLVK